MLGSCLHATYYGLHIICNLTQHFLTDRGQHAREQRPCQGAVRSSCCPSNSGCASTAMRSKTIRASRSQAAAGTYLIQLYHSIMSLWPKRGYNASLLSIADPPSIPLSPWTEAPAKSHEHLHTAQEALLLVNGQVNDELTGHFKLA
jgi:hypothetical protein